MIKCQPQCFEGERKISPGFDMEDLDKNKMEWVEIIEPRTKEHMYANLTTGECVWDPPPGVHVKRTTDSQWWELFDHKTSRFYYYNAASQRTVWHRPNNCDIIPLAKLQTLKQNTQVKTPGQESCPAPGEATGGGCNSSTLSSTDSRPSVKKESVATQTPSRSALSRSEWNGSTSGGGGKGSGGGGSSRRSAEKNGTNSVSESAGGTGTQTKSTSPVASPRPHRRHHHHHHHHHHNHQCSSSSGRNHPQQQQQSDEEAQAAQQPLNPLDKKSSRRGTGTQAGGWYSRHGKSQDSGRSSDSSSTLSLNKRTDKAQQQQQQQAGGLLLTSPLRGSTPGSGRRTLDPIPLEFGTPLSGRRAGNGHKGNGLEQLTRQRSLDAESGPSSERHHLGGGLLFSSGSGGTNNNGTAPSAARVGNKPSDLFYRDGSLSRSLSFMHQQRSRPQTARGQGPLFDLWSPQREHLFGLGESSGGSQGAGVDSLCTPMINRKQRSLESSSGGGGKPRSAQHQQLLDSLRSNPTHPSPGRQLQRPLGSSSSFRCTTSTGTSVSSNNSHHQHHPAGQQQLGGSFGSDSSPSPKHERERDSLNRHRILRSGDSSPQHSAGDSGLATTGSRASQDSTSARTKTTAANAIAAAANAATPPTASAKVAEQPSASSATTGAGSTEPEASGGDYDAVPLYSNIDYNYYLDPKAQAHLLPLQQYILEQAKLSGYRFGDSSPISEEGGGRAVGSDPRHHFPSDEEEDEEDGHRRAGQHRHHRGNHRLHVHRHLEHSNDDSDDFADDEGMSNVDDSSSLEYLDESQYLEEDDHYTQFLLPPVPPQRLQSKTVQQLQQQQQLADLAIVEPEYTEADPGGPHHFMHHHYRSVTDGGKGPPQASASASGGGAAAASSSKLMTSGSSSSLRPRPKESPAAHQPGSLYSPVMERAGPFGSVDAFHLPLATADVSASASSLQTGSLQRSPSSVGSKSAITPTDGDIEKYAQSNLNIHKKGLFRKNLTIRDMLSWSKDPIRKPMLPLEDKQLKKEACDLFKLVQVYMGDRKCKPGMTSNSVALELCNHAWNKPALRDELYLHICRQTTENPRKESLRRGWELMAVCLYFFPPSPKLEPYLDGYINRHRDPGLNFTEVDKWPIHVQVSHYATISCRRLQRIGASGRRNERKPTLEEIEQARLQIFRPSMFGNTLEEIMSVQRDRFPHRKLPWIQTTLSEEILRLQGAQTEGIFRVPADVDEVNSLKNRMDQWEVGQVSDAHVPASLLKLWYRELYESLIPDELYPDCIQYCTDPERAVSIVHRLPEFHRLVLSYLIRFLQVFSQTEVASVTKMDASNLAMVMAPNCLRCNASDPKVIFDNARKEMAFIRTLIQHLDTSFMEGIV